MSKLTDPIRLQNTVIKNRILMPPQVCFNWADHEGYETVSRARHYGKRAKGGAGVIVVEATAVLKSGRIIETQLGLWEEGQIQQFKNIARACHEHGTKVIVQLVHAGSKSIGDPVVSSSAHEVPGKTCLSMTSQQISEVKSAFASAALRAEEAGLDGVEIHGAHGYLLNQFTSKLINQRDDSYGGDLDSRLEFPLEIIREIKSLVSDTFLISYRFGVNDPTFEEDHYFAKRLAEAGVSLLNVSSGIEACL